MYEPYGEKKKFKIDFSKIKEKVKQKLSDLNFGNINKTTYVVAALLLLVTVGSITGWVTYTGKVTEMEQQFMVMEKQIQTLQEDLDGLNHDLETCNQNLESTEINLEEKKQELSSTVSALEEARNNLGICNDEKSDLSLMISSLETDLEVANKDLEDLNDEYIDLKNDFDILACKIAKVSSCDYYTLEDDTRVVCCVKYEGKYICSGNVVDSDNISSVDC